jgi:UDP:flavonoid glycosyltransferase YjiC (YdhE family)
LYFAVKKRSEKMKILFFPSDSGGGFGHISRCLVIAKEAQKRGHICAFVTSNNKYHQNLLKHFQIYTIKQNRGWKPLLFALKAMLFRSGCSHSPVFTEFSGLDLQVVRDGLASHKIVNKILTQYTQIIDNFNPHLLLGDTNLLTWILSRRVDLPVVQIVRYASHPETSKLIWWKIEPKGVIPPNSSALFNPLLTGMGLRAIKRAEDLLRGDLFIVPSIPEIEPIPEDGKTVHVGALTISIRNDGTPSWFQEIDNNQPLVYVTIGGGAGPVGNKSFFSTIVEAFTDKPIQVVVSTSDKFDLLDFPNLPKNIRIFKWVPGKFMISKADLVVFHGGYGTMMESIVCGKPTITIPFQSEQEGNGRRLEQLGCGLVVKLSAEAYKRIEAKWKYGTYSFLVQNRYDLTAEELFRAVDKILSGSESLNKAKNLQRKIREYHGAEEAMELIEKHWG